MGIEELLYSAFTGLVSAGVHSKGVCRYGRTAVLCLYRFVPAGEAGVTTAGAGHSHGITWAGPSANNSNSPRQSVGAPPKGSQWTRKWSWLVKTTTTTTTGR